MKNDTLLVALAFILVILCMLICVVALWQPPAAILPSFTPSTTAPTEESPLPTQAVMEPAQTAPTVPPTTSPEETTEPTVHEHTYTGKVTKAPTCTASGVRSYSCECGASYQENIEPLAHAYVITDQAPSCIRDGYTSYHCKICGYSYMEPGADALGHSFGPWTVTKAPTESSAGAATRYCSHCQETETVTLPSLD